MDDSRIVLLMGRKRLATVESVRVTSLDGKHKHILQKRDLQGVAALPAVEYLILER